MSDLEGKGNQIRISPKVHIGSMFLIGARSNNLVSFPTHPAYVHIPVHIVGSNQKRTWLETRHGLRSMVQVEYLLDDKPIEA